MKGFRTLISVIFVLVLAYTLFVLIPERIYAEWTSRLGYISYVAFPLFMVFCFLLVDTLLGRFLSLLEKLFNLLAGVIYGVKGKENRRHARRALFNSMLFRYEDAAGGFMNAGLYLQGARCFEKAGINESAAQAYFAAKEYRKAAESFLSAKKYESAGECYVRLGDDSSAIEAFYKSGEKLLLEGKITMSAQAFLKAREYARAAELLKKSGHVLEAAETYEKADDLVKAAELYLEAGREELLRFQKQATYRPDFESNEAALKSAEKAGELFLKLGAQDKAMEAFELMGDHDKVAEILISKGEVKEAAAIYEKFQMWRKAGDCYDRLGLANDVLRMEAHQALENRLWQRAALLFEKLQDYQKALEIYREARDDAGQAHCLERLGRPLAAANYYLKINDLAKAAELYEKSGNYKEAADLYRELGNSEKEYSCIARSGNPFHAAALERERGNLEKTIDILRSVPNFSPDYKSSMLLMAQCYVDLDRPALAADCFEKILPSMTPNENNIENFYLYGCILEKTENYHYALDLFQKVQDVKKDYKDVKERMNILQTIVSNKLKISVDALLKKRRLLNQKKESPSSLETIVDKISPIDGINEQKTILEEPYTIIEEPDTSIDNPDSTL